MDPSASIVILKAMEGLSARINVTAENIANANTPGYRPLRVSFEQALVAAAAQGEAAVRAVRPEITQEPLSGQGLRLDKELATDATTASRFSALVEILNRQLQLQGVAIMGNG